MHIDIYATLDSTRVYKVLCMCDFARELARPTSLAYELILRAHPASSLRSSPNPFGLWAGDDLIRSCPDLKFSTDLEWKMRLTSIVTRDLSNPDLNPTPVYRFEMNRL
ncbi:hypothetical protein PVK06_008415 [Gossypium arboreum]|uniref:Uncharacterized protein n=1 Tax=Gossypium arboreum TaxID=29729 RepID=A0ABR0QJX3_GOSAR|nr:hypothetical protein PVK06_008415 [Gossypium arboreum]